MFLLKMILIISILYEIYIYMKIENNNSLWIFIFNF